MKTTESLVTLFTQITEEWKTWSQVSFERVVDQRLNYIIIARVVISCPSELLKYRFQFAGMSSIRAHESRGRGGR